jgi:hypothetical protein
MTRAAAAILAATLLLPPAGASAQKLESFENVLKKGADKSGDSDSKSGASSRNELDLGSDRWDSCETLALCLLEITIRLGTEATLEYAGFRERGHPTIPTVRADGSYQRIYDNIDAYSYRGELGWTLFGTAFEYMQFHERNPEDRLTSWYWEALYRTAPSPAFRLDWAAGYREFRRSGNFGGAQTGASLGVYPMKQWGLELDGRWGSINDQVLADYRGRLILAIPSWKAVAIRAGYRAVRAGDVTLHGPEFGLTLVY